MNDFIKYQHVERYGTSETEGITEGLVYCFYKVDGTNGSIWFDKDGFIRCGSRNRELDVHNDNAGFMNAVVADPRYLHFFTRYPNLRLFGEWLVPHSLKTYNDNAWRKFYVFDVLDGDGSVLPYDTYKVLLDEFSIDYIPPLCIFKNPTDEMIIKTLDKCGQFLIEDGSGLGEGVVLKNYDYVNRHGRQTWAKLITNEFKTIHHKEMGAPLVVGSKIVEEEIVFDFVTEHFILKEKAKIEVANGGEWTNKDIPKLLGVVYYELIREEIWNILKKYKNPKINFALLNKMTINKVKQTIGL